MLERNKYVKYFIDFNKSLLLLELQAIFKKQFRL